METKKLINITIEIVRGDITESDADVIVNAANSGLWMGSGVAGAIKAKGGHIIEEEALRKGPIKPGQAVITGAGRLKARFIAHAAVMGEDLKTSASYIRSGTLAALSAAESVSMESVALPALGTGVGSFPVKDCAKVMFQAIRDFDKAGPSHIKRVKIVLFSARAFNDFHTEFLKIKL